MCLSTTFNVIIANKDYLLSYNITTPVNTHQQHVKMTKKKLYEKVTVTN